MRGTQRVSVAIARKSVFHALSVFAFVLPHVLPAQMQQSAQVTATVITALPSIRAKGDTTLKKVSVAAIVRDRIVTYDEKQRRLLFFDFAGQLVRRVDAASSRVSSPFRGVAWLGRCAPHLLFVADPITKRMLVIDAYGNVIRSFRFSAMARRWACSEDGSIGTLMLPTSLPRGVAEKSLAAAPLVISDASGQELRQLADIPVGDTRFGGALTSIALSSSALYVGTGDTPALQEVSRSTWRTRPLSLARIEQKEMSDTEFAVIVERQLGGLWPDSIVARTSRLPHPRFHPLFREIRATRSGVLWLTLSPASANVTRLRAVAADGSTIGELQWPTAGRLLDADANHLLITSSGPEGLDSVVLLSVAWPRSARTGIRSRPDHGIGNGAR